MADAASPLESMDLSGMGEALTQAQGQETSQAAEAARDAAQNAAKAQKPGPKVPEGPVQSLDFILDIPLRVTVELGRSKMTVRDVLQLAQGSVVELSKFAGEPLEILINDRLIARGEVVVVNEKFGVRLTDIISPVDRIEQLK